jgi:hypothetical protein
MKKKLTRILGVGVTLALLVSLLAMAVPASAGTLYWSAETIPSTTGRVLLDGSDVTDIAVSGDTIYAGVGDNYLYKSTNGGVSWSRFATTEDTDLVAVAPDDPNIVSYADTTTLNVWVDTYGGSYINYYNLGVPQEGAAAACTAIHDIDLSIAKGGVNYIGIAGEESGPFANVWWYNLGAVAASWTEGNDRTGFGVTTGNSTAAALEFSPAFSSDEMLCVITSDYGVDSSDTDYIRFEIYSFDASAWNQTGAGLTGYPATVASDDWYTGIDAASIALSPNYLGSDESDRLGIVGITLQGGDTAATDDNGIYAMYDYYATGIKNGTLYEINSVDYDGTNMVAGRYNTNTVYRSANPQSTTPTVSGSTSRKGPGMDESGVDEKTVVLFAGDDVVAGTSGNCSAFATSSDLGKTFNDISLIDTSFSSIHDMEVTADGSRIYISSDDGADYSLFSYNDGWQRVLCLEGTTNVMVRMAPDDPDVVYVIDQSTDDLWLSQTGGTVRWQLRNCTVDIQDFVVEGDGSTVYALQDSSSSGRVTKSTNFGFTWGSTQDTYLYGANQLVGIGEGLLLASDDDGYVSYSTDGNSSWVPIIYAVGGTSYDVCVIADGLEDGDHIYAGIDDSSSNIYRWTIGTNTTSWTDILPGNVGSYSVTDIALQDGILYALGNTGSATRCFRSINPTATSTSVKFSNLDSSGRFNTWTQTLRTSTGKLWAIDTEPSPDIIQSYGDTIALVAPTLVAPADGAILEVNPITGRSYNVTFTWERPSYANEYDLWIATDSSFYEFVSSYDVDTDSSTVVSIVGPYANNMLDFIPETTYYWMVRVDVPSYSPWSEVRSFTVEDEPITPPVEVVDPEIVIPEIELPEIVVEIPPTEPVQVEQPINQGAIWAIIGIGAILVIAVIILIVRTRRVP